MKSPANFPPEPAREEIVSRALNEHGFLFQDRVCTLFAEKKTALWRLAAFEFPVSLHSPLAQEETRIDLVLERKFLGGIEWFLPIESKRANPDYKTWVFFNERPRDVPQGSQSIYFQSGQLTGSWDHQGGVSPTGSCLDS